MENNNQDWINDINKRLEDLRAAYKESQESGETFSRAQSYRGKNGGKTTKERRSGGFFLSSVQRELSSRRTSFGPGHDFTNEERAKGHDHENSFRNKKVECSVCGCSTTTANYARWHEEKCKFPMLLEIYDKLNDVFDRKDLENVTTKVGISKSIMNNFIYGYESHHFCEIIDTVKRNIIYKKLEKPTK
jgi:hypothetical protein